MGWCPRRADLEPDPTWRTAQVVHGLARQYTASACLGVEKMVAAGQRAAFPASLFIALEAEYGRCATYLDALNYESGIFIFVMTKLLCAGSARRS